MRERLETTIGRMVKTTKKTKDMMSMCRLQIVFRTVTVGKMEWGRHVLLGRVC